MQIHELPAGSPASGLQFAGDTGSQTQKIDYDALANAILSKLTTKTFDIKSESQTIIAALNALGDASKQGVANDLVTTAAGLVLDARQGKALDDKITSLNSRTNFGNSVSYDETPNNRLFIRQGDTVYFSFQGESKARSEGQLLFTVPQGYRPTNTIYISGTLGTVPCIFALRENGQCSIYIAASYPTGRAYLRGSYLV